MSNNIVQINNNIMKSAKFFVEFFDFRSFTQDMLGEDFTMGSTWLSFLNSTPKFSVPIKENGMGKMTRANILWYRNISIQDSVTLTLDDSDEYNIMNFIEKGITAKDVDLDELIYLGAIVKMTYIDLYGNTQEERLMVGRVELSDFSNDNLQIKVLPLNDIMKDIEFEESVLKIPNASSYNFIPLEQAFANTLNVPNNEINDLAYPATPFNLEKSTYVPSDGVDIVATDTNLPTGAEIYAEDYARNPRFGYYTHCQFFYMPNEPGCGVKITIYADNNEEISSQITYTPGWNIWGNSVDAFAAFDAVSPNSVIARTFKDYSRFFRPFAVVFATQEESDAFNDGNYRIRRDINYTGALSGGIDNSLYDPEIQTGYWRQELITGGEYQCRPNDVLIYFEQLGDVMPSIDTTSTILYDNHANIYVYNLTRDIVYFNHISSLVTTNPLPKQWLGIRTYIPTTALNYASGLNYDDVDYVDFVSNIKPMCAVKPSSQRFLVASRRSFKDGQAATSSGYGGFFTGEKTGLPIAFGDYNLNDETDYTRVEKMLDYIQKNMKPKSVKLSFDGKEIFFFKSQVSDFGSWPSNWNPLEVTHDKYNNAYEFSAFNYICSKSLYIQRDSKTDFNQLEYTSRAIVTGFKLFYTEISQLTTTSSIVLQNNPLWNYDSGLATIDSLAIVKTVTDNFYVFSEDILFNGYHIGSINTYKHTTNIFWCWQDKIYKRLVIDKNYVDSYNILDYNPNIDRAIIQKSDELVYVDTLTNTELEDAFVVGIEFILSMDRTRFIFTNPLGGESDVLYRISPVTDEPVRLLSFTGNRYQAMLGLSKTFFKNLSYDNNGVLQVGFELDNGVININNDVSISAKQNKVAVDKIEWEKKDLVKNQFTSLDNDNAGNQQEDDNSYDKNVSLSLWSTKDVDLNISLQRISATEVNWTAFNQFGSESGTYTDTLFSFFTINLTGVFAGISIDCNFFNTELKQGESFSGTIKRRKLQSQNVRDDIANIGNNFPFLKKNTYTLKPSFLYKLNKDEYKQVVVSKFKVGDRIRKMKEYVITLPSLILFDENFSILSLMEKVYFECKKPYTNGVVKCDIEYIKYDFNQKTTEFKIIYLE